MLRKNDKKRRFFQVFTLFASLSMLTAFAGLPQFLTSKAKSWAFIQSVGGMAVSVEGTTLTVDCDVSGLKSITVKPTLINSGIGVRDLKVKRKGKTIFLTLKTCVIGKGVKTSPDPVDLSGYPDGTYKVMYRDPKGPTHLINTIFLKHGSAGATGLPVEERAGTVSYSPMLMMSSPPPGRFSGARFPAEELRHLNKLVGKGVVIDSDDPEGRKQGLQHFYSYKLGGKFNYAGEHYPRVDILALHRHSSLVGMKHVVLLLTGQQEGRKVVYTRNPELVAYVLSEDFKQKLLAWNPGMKEKINPFESMVFTISPLTDLVYVDPSTAATQHPLVCGKGRDYPEGREMLFRSKTLGTTVHAVFPPGVKPPKKLDGVFTLRGDYQMIKKWDSYGAKKPQGTYTYFVVTSYEQKEEK
ncbi:MAG: hypothetical protein RRC34_04270 [Lentisphaeria bacterium]|nr:hypothetical protein [Lentisphaeria bacterium]